MKIKSPRFFLLLLSLLCGAAVANAQTGITSSPYTIGENLTYEGTINKAIFRGINVAEVKFAVSAAPNKKDFIINSEAISKGSLISLFRFKFLEKISSIVDGKNFSILRSVRRDEQGDRAREGEAVFDYAAKTVTYVEIDPNDPTRPTRRIATPIEKNTYDLVSAIYAMRRLPLAVGKTFVLNVSDSGLVYKVPVRVTARETQKSVIGKSICFRLEPEIFGDGRMIEQKGRMSIWITDDARRLPVRGQINTSAGGIAFDLDIRLRRVEIQKN
jgi:hypothetical protein